MRIGKAVKALVYGKTVGRRAWRWRDAETAGYSEPALWRQQKVLHMLDLKRIGVFYFADKGRGPLDTDSRLEYQFTSEDMLADDWEVQS